MQKNDNDNVPRAHRTTPSGATGPTNVHRPSARYRPDSRKVMTTFQLSRTHYKVWLINV